MPRPVFLPVYRRLLQALGPSHWWPAESPLEVMIGAILTQNTSWKNVERALSALREATDLVPERILSLDQDVLAACIRSSGYYNQKAHRLSLFLRWFSQFDFDPKRLGRHHPVGGLRSELLSLKGIGPETADSILCYALGLPYFVVDAYTFRLVDRLSLGAYPGYEHLRAAVESEFRHEFSGDRLVTQHLNEFHALIVRHGNTVCRKRSPSCGECSLRSRCRSRNGL